MKPKGQNKGRFRTRRPHPAPVEVGVDSTVFLYRLPRAAELLSMSLNTLKERIREGKIAAVYTGKAGSKTNKGIRISDAEIHRFISANEVRVAPA